MAAKRKSSPPPPAQSSTSDEDSSSEEEQTVAQPTPSRAPTAKRTEGDDDESESGSESDPDPPTKTLNTPKKPEESSDSSEEETEDEDEEEEVEKPKLPVKEPESKPDKKKLKLSDPDQSPSKKSSSIAPRIWSSEDEMALIKGLSEYHAKHGKIPAQKDYSSFLSGITGSIGFPVTEKQLANKLRQIKHNYNQNIKKGSDVNISNPHKRAVFEMSKRLFEGSNKPQKKDVSLEADSDAGTESGGVANGGVSNHGAVAKSGQRYFYLRGLIEDLSSRQQCSGWLSTVDDVVARIGKSRARDLEAKTKMLRIDALKLCAREDKLKAELLSTLADEMADD